MKQKIPKIGTWPQPEKPVTFEIPIEILLEGGLTKAEVTLYPSILGIRVPVSFLQAVTRTRQCRALAQKFDVLLISK